MVLNGYIMKTKTVPIVLIYLLASYCAAQEKCPNDPTAAFHVSGTAVSLPTGGFLLVRKQGQVGAIRLTTLNAFGSSGVGSSTYESYFQVDGSMPFNAQTAVKHSGNVNI